MSLVAVILRYCNEIGSFGEANNYVKVFDKNVAPFGNMINDH